MPGVALVGDEIVFDKTGFNAFICTAIDHVLRNLGVTELVCCGVLTDECVLGTVKSACYLGYDCTVLTVKVRPLNKYVIDVRCTMYTRKLVKYDVRKMLVIIL